MVGVKKRQGQKQGYKRENKRLETSYRKSKQKMEMGRSPGKTLRQQIDTRTQRYRMGTPRTYTQARRQAEQTLVG